jgi:L-lysine exporter family protein LysE/ArgO
MSVDVAQSFLSVPAPLAQGFAVMASLIVAIGAQNALVLRQGLARSHVAAVVAFCTASDWLLTAAGIVGVGTLVAHSPGLLHGLAAYALRAARSAWRDTTGSLAPVEV